MDMRLARLGRFAMGATLGGLFVGVAEGVYRGVSPLYTGALYAALWAVIGAGIAFAVAALFRHRSVLGPLASWGIVTAVASSAWVLVRLVIVRDLMHEDPSSGPVGLAGGFAAALVLGIAVRLLTRKLDEGLDIARQSMRPWGFPAGAVILFTLLALGGGDDLPDQIPKATRDFHSTGVVLVVADALRADALGPYGAGPHRGKVATPHIDAFARQALVFSDASAQASWTKPAVASLLTSRHVSAHGTTAESAVLPETLPTVASALRDKNVYTAAVVASPSIEEGYGFARGFDMFRYLAPVRYVGAPRGAHRIAAYNAYRGLRERIFEMHRQPEHFYRPAATVSAVALRILDHAATGNRFFLYLHYMEPHDPYFADEGTSYARISEPTPPREAAPAMRLAYRDEVRRFDQAFGELLRALAERGLNGSTTVILTADHGEEFADHGGFYHGTTLYEEQISLPLLIRGPGIVPGRETRLTRQIDIAPTILGRFGVAPPHSWEGLDLLDEPPDITQSLAEVNHQGSQLVSLRTASAESALKLIVANADNPRRLPSKELFDLARDPREQSPMPVVPEHLEALEDALAEAQKQARRGGATAGRRRIDASADAALRALGYAQ
jgi:arylsulfatase A-like enzyme